MKITIVRHTSVKCTADVCYGLSDVEVADSFETEAQQVKEMLINRTFEHVYSSPLTRCRKLAAYCGYNNPQTDTRLLELNFGDWEGTRWDEITDPHLQRWYADWINECPTNGESFAAQVARVKLFLEQLKAEKKDNVLVFSHAGVIRAVAVLLNLVAIEKCFTDFPVAYGQIFEFAGNTLK